MNNWKDDPAIDRVRARIRSTLLLALFALVAGVCIAHIHNALLRALLAAMEVLPH